VLGVSISFITKLFRRRRDAGTIAPKPRAGGVACSLDDADLRRVRKLVEEQPDATLAELCQRLHARGGATVRPWTMCRALQRLGLVRKKSPFTRRSAIRLA